MSKILALIVLLIPNILFGQIETKTIKVKSSKIDKIKEKFDVLKNTDTKHGFYEMKRANKTVIRGFYLQGKKDSIWTYYSVDGLHLIAKGQYKNDVKTGIWEYFTLKGDLVQKYNHKTDSLLYYNYQKEFEMFGKQAQKLTPDTSNLIIPFFIGGLSWMHTIIEVNMRYPEQEYWNLKTGKVYVQFVVNGDGVISESKVVKSSGENFDNESIRLVNLLSDNWIPGTKDGKKVKCSMTVPLNYNLN